MKKISRGVKRKLFFAACAILALAFYNAALADLTLPGYSTSAPPADPNATGTPEGLQIPGGLIFQDVAPAEQTAGPKPGPRLIRVDPKSKVVYYVTLNSLKIPMWTTTVFNSYHNKWADVETVAQEEFDQYENAEYIKLIGNGRVYKIEGRTKRYVTPEAAQALEIDPASVVEINRADYNSYKTGKNFTADDVEG